MEGGKGRGGLYGRRGTTGWEGVVSLPLATEGEVGEGSLAVVLSSPLL